MASAQNTVTIKGYAIAEDVDGYGGGTITVTGRNAKISGWGSLSSTSWSDNATVNGMEVSTTANEAINKGPLSTKTAGIKVKLNASANDGFYFAGFAMSNTLTPSITPSSLPWESDEIAYGSTLVEYYAIFKRIIHVTNIDDISVWLENGSIQSEFATVTATAHGAKDGSQMTITLIDDPDFADDIAANNFQLYDANVTTIFSPGTVTYSNPGEFTFKVGYVGNLDMADLEDKYASVKLSFGTDEKIIHIKLSPLPTVTFKGTNGKGEYESNVLADFDTESSDSKSVQLNNTRLKGITLKLLTDPSDDQIFYGWQVTHAGGEIEVLSNEVEIKRDFSNGDIIEPLFVPNTCGYMVMQDDGSTKTEWAGLTGGLVTTYWQYKMTPKFMSYDLQEALNVATAGQFVVFENFATIFSKLNITRPDGFEKPANVTEAILPKGDGYTIPNGVTLLIPANANYAYGMDKFDTKCCVSNSGLSPYRKLIIGSGTQMTVNGTLCVFAYITSTGGVNGSPNACGVIELQDGAHIEVNGKLYSYGYIINPTTTTITSTNINSVGKITANSTAEVYETFQIADWRGGNATSGMLNNEKDVFPINQYYIQNIEVPITFITGSKESLSTAVDVTGMGTVIAEAYFLLPSSNSDDGFFKLGSNTSITKYYETQSDRLHFIVNGKSLANTASIENIYLPISSYKVNSTDYVLAVTNNMDISLNNVTMELKYDMCFLPGSTLNINPNAKLTINGTSGNPASVFVYDFEWSSQDGIGTQGAQKGYFGIENSTIKLLTKRPGGFKTPRRTISKDASIVVNGILEIGQYGELYTTKAGDAEGTDWTSYSYGAEITSTGNGRAKFIGIGDLDLTYQAHQQIATAENGNKNNVIDRYLNIPVSSAQLKNADGTYKATTLEDVGKIFVYKEGTWQEPQWILPTFETTLPTKVFDGEEVQLQISTPDKDQHPWVITLDGEGFTTDGELKTASVTYNASMGDYIKFPIHYAVLNKDGTHPATITVQHSSDTYTTTINATENYKPIFSVAPASPEKLNIGETYVGTPLPVPASSVVNPTKDNVTSLMTDNTYYSRLSWSVVSNSNPEFTFEFGEDMNALSGAKITFTPTSPDQKEATIKLRATYKDANNTEIHSDGVELKVTATAKALETNNFTLTADCQNDLNNMCVGIPVTLKFQGLTKNTKPLDFTFNNNGAVGSEVLKLSGEGTVAEPYTITATSVPANMPTIIISQDPDGTYEGYTTEAYTTDIQNCEPSVQWNWSDLYVGESYDTPYYTTNGDGDVTLTLTKVTKAGVEVDANQVIDYDPAAKTATILSDLTDEYIATFTFSQEATASFSPFITTFTAAIYPRPNVLPVCVKSEREFKGLTSANKDASFQEDNQVVFAANASWTMHFKGVPNVLSFTPTATTQLLVQESANGSTWDNTSLYEQVVADTPYEVELLPTTRYVKFTVVQASNLQNICVSEFANMVKADVEKLYMPISTDPTNNPTTHTITFTYNNDQDMQVMVPDGNFTATPNVLPAKPDGYAQTIVTITSKATTEYNSNLRVVTISGATQTDQLIIPIETYRFPQKLPIQLEDGKDDAKRFYYVTTLHKDIEWDAANYAINLKKRTSDVNDKPYVTFAFDGAPSFISFVPLVDDNPSNWEIKESADGTVWNTPEQTSTLVDGVLKQTLRHNTRYVRVTYVGNNMEVVKMTKVNILTAQGAIPSVEELKLTEANEYTTELSVGADLNITTVNITNMTISVDNSNFTLSYGGETPATQFENISGIANVFGEDVVGELPFKVFWNADVASDFATITITTQNGDEVKPLATVSLIGNANSITAEDEIWTGVDPTKHTLLGSFAGIDAIEGNDGIGYRKVNLNNAFDEAGKALFDYLIIYGETTTTDGQRDITTPTTQKGSNAKTPMYVYMRVDDQYQFWEMEENVNSGTKMFSSLSVESGTKLRVYITGFCPYASTGYTKADEGVWYFKGHDNAYLEIYLDDCYIYSRNKTPDGHSFAGRGDGQSFTEAAVRGSGGVLVFENQDDDDLNQYFNVTIHTNGNNMFKSTYGCFFELIQGLRVYQVSSPIQVHLAVDQEGVDYKNSGTILSFDDKWPTNSADDSETKRTNGRLSLQKQHNNAPSIDMGNSQTIVNFNGGQVELQNAAVVSQNYKTTFAISFRGGQFAGFDMALGIGTDDTGGTIRFNDGTTTVIPLWVDEVYKNYYLIDEENGEQVTRQYQGKTQYRTSCLRCPTDTRVTGGSHCMMRACSDPTSLGGAPKNASGDPLGLYRYPQHPATGHLGGWSLITDGNGLVKPNDPYFPVDDYNVESVTPNPGEDGQIDEIHCSTACDDYLNFWFTEGQESSVKPEQEGNKYSYWKASVTKLRAEFMGYKREVGGPEDAQITEGEVVANLLYCQLDQNMHDVISEKDSEGNYTYEAPVKMPTDQLGYDYASIKPSEVGEELQNYVVTVSPNPDVNAAPTPVPRDYEVLDKVYYIMPATADIWMTFVPPFDVEKLWVVETVDEQELIDYAATHTRQEVLKVQAKHNADFATFFAVTIALQYDKPFEQMYQEYLSWAREQDGHTGAASDYSKRGKIQLVHYNGNNWRDAHYYLYKNTENWEYDANEQFITHWEIVPEVAPGWPIMDQGEVYSFLLPYCQGCDVQANSDGTIKLENGLPITTQRDYWDYWSGKLLIFESTQKSITNPHKINGENRHSALLQIPTEPGLTLTGNSTFALMKPSSDMINDEYLYPYSPVLNKEGYELADTETPLSIQPTASFIKENIGEELDGQSISMITYSGKVIYSPNSGNGDNSETSVSHTPTIGGNNSLFVTATQQGINVAVSAPQYVRVFSATGSTIYSGIVQTAVDVAIPTTGVYVVAGESEVQKIWVE